MTKTEALQQCLDLWTWMRNEKKTSSKDKADWPGWLTVEDGYMCYCPACSYALEQRMLLDYYVHLCDLCPVWTDGKTCCDDGEGFLAFYGDIGTPEDAQQIIDRVKAVMKLEGDKS
jgi:hypothetical protein